jgi:anti-sigma regulatory factor (Ser/Thr protein kinase)
VPTPHRVYAFAFPCVSNLSLSGRTPGPAAQLEGVFTDASITLAGTPSSASLARSFVRDRLQGWGCVAEMDSAQLVASELVTNAVLHAGSEIQLTLRADPCSVRVEVGDCSSRVPMKRLRPSTLQTGRGLEILGSVASAWGVEPRDNGKTVWAELSR